MKEISKYFQQRRYSIVNAEDTPAMVPTPSHNAENGAVVGVLSADKQRRKSLKANRSMNPARILGSFFRERSGKKGARSPKCAFVLLAAGVLALAAAVLVKIFHPYDLIFNWKLVFDEGGEIFDMWAQPPVDLYIKIYLFNITNAEAFLAGREKMNVQQVGPYTYKEIMTHQNITFNSNHTVSTRPKHPLIWQEHLSEGHREDDEVVMLNIAMLAISHLAADRSYFFRMALNTLFITSNSLPIVRMTAKEFMFGYSSSLTTLGNTFLPNWISFEKVGLIDRMYDFDTDFETFHTGVPNPSISGLYATYRGTPNLPQWNGEDCSNIELASDGTKFKSYLQPNESLKFFRKSMCRPMNLHRIGEAETYGSLRGYKYVFEENALDNGAHNEKNKCFCRHGLCQPSGLIDVTDCYYGFPISLSYPHFMLGDAGLQENITGLTPDQAKHSSAFVIQPESGLPLSISVKVQINMHFNDFSTMPRVAQFSHLTAPMLWFEIVMPELPTALDNRFNFYLNILPYLDPVVFWGALVLGLGLLLYAVTRATLRMSLLASPSTTISEGLIYSKAVLLPATNTAVYNPCETRLLTNDEKLASVQQKNSYDSSPVHQIVRDFEKLYTEIDTKSLCAETPFVLEVETPLSESADEGNESDTETLSRDSTTSTSYTDVPVECGHDECYTKPQSELKSFNSCRSSGLATSVHDSNSTVALDSASDVSQSSSRNNNRRWSLFEPKNAARLTAAPKSTQYLHLV